MENLEITGGKGLRVCIYLRASGKEQELSVGQQRAEVRRFCEGRGWIIVAEYIDEGKSGSKNVKKRVAFLRMIADASKGLWSCIVLYNSSRFGRLKVLDGAEHKKTLAQYGIYLETVTEGRIDWNTEEGEFKDFIYTKANHKYSTDLAKATVRGRHDILRLGHWPIGEIPFGYDREFIEDGISQMVIPRDRPFRKPRNWHTHLKTNTTEAAIVRDIFKRYGKTDISGRQLVRELNSENIPSPGTAWTSQMLSKTLRDHAYIGVCRIGLGKRGPKEAHSRMSQTVREDACPVIVDHDLFVKVQQRIAKRKEDKSNSSQTKAGALSGVLICGHCGFRMDKRERGGKVYYVCSSANRRQHLGCRQWSVRETDLLPLLAAELLEAVDLELVRRLEAKPKDRSVNISAQKDNVAKLEKTYARAKTNLLRIDPEMFQEMQAETLALKQELDKAKNTLTILENDVARTAALAVADYWKANRNKVVEIAVPRWTKDGGNKQEFNPGWTRKMIRTIAERESIRDLLKSLNATLTLHWSPKGERYFSLDTGVLRAEVGGNGSYDLNSMHTQSIIIERTLKFVGLGRGVDGRYRGRNPNQTLPALAVT